MGDPIPGGLLIERSDQILRITLAKPERRNAFDGAMIATLATTFRDPGSARAIVIGGDGPHFSAGADLGWMESATTEAARLDQSRALQRFLVAIDRCPLPVIANVRGFCLGAACGIVAAADIALASPDATFGLPEVRYGLIPAVVAPYIIRRVSSAHARRYLVTGERFSAPRAAQIGLISELAEDDDTLVALLNSILATAPRASQLAKELACSAVSEARQPELMAEVRATLEAEEGLAAAKQKRTPSWN
jgi:methylglutaconyl-CoA hydratase